MTKIFNNIFIILATNGAILIIPGVNFLLVAKYALLGGFSKGFYCAVGITIAIMLHTVLAIFSVSTFFKDCPIVFSGIRYVGACYLIYIGTKFLVSVLKDDPKSIGQVTLKSKKIHVFLNGFLIDLFQPFVSIFYLTLFSSLIESDESFIGLFCYSITIFILTLSWFSFVAFFFSYRNMRICFKYKGKYIQIFSAIMMYYFSSKLIFSF